MTYKFEITAKKRSQCQTWPNLDKFKPDSAFVETSVTQLENYYGPSMIHRIRTQMNRKGDGFELEIGQPRCEEPYYGSNVCMSVMKLKIIAFQGHLTVQNVFFLEMR